LKFIKYHIFTRYLDSKVWYLNSKMWYLDTKGLVSGLKSLVSELKNVVSGHKNSSQTLGIQSFQKADKYLTNILTNKVRQIFDYNDYSVVVVFLEF